MSAHGVTLSRAEVKRLHGQPQSLCIVGTGAYKYVSSLKMMLGPSSKHNNEVCADGSVLYVPPKRSWTVLLDQQRCFLVLVGVGASTSCLGWYYVNSRVGERAELLRARKYEPGQTAKVSRPTCLAAASRTELAELGRYRTYRSSNCNSTAATNAHARARTRKITSTTTHRYPTRTPSGERRDAQAEKEDDNDADVEEEGEEKEKEKEEEENDDDDDDDQGRRLPRAESRRIVPVVGCDAHQSGLERLWTQFFQINQFQYTYEGISLQIKVDGGMHLYTPDYLLRNTTPPCLVEIKPARPLQHEYARSAACARAIHGLGLSHVMVCGAPTPPVCSPEDERNPAERFHCQRYECIVFTAAGAHADAAVTTRWGCFFARDTAHAGEHKHGPHFIFSDDLSSFYGGGGGPGDSAGAGSSDLVYPSASRKRMRS